MTKTTNDKSIDSIISLCKRRGFVFPGSEIYGGLANTWDYGPLGVELKNNIKQLWWKRFVQDRDDMVGLDSSLLMNTKVWEASGHISTFSDPLVECKKCHTRFRADKLFEDISGISISEGFKQFIIEGKNKIIQEYDKVIKQKHIKLAELEISMAQTEAKLAKLKIKFIKSGGEPDDFNKIKSSKKVDNTFDIPEVTNVSLAQKEFTKILDGGEPAYLEYLVKNKKLECPENNCNSNEFTQPQNFNLMLKTFLGPVEDEKNTVYFRPETAQGIFVNFKNIVDTTRKKLPFGVGQIGKAFRNEITPGNFIFRTREFEQMEIEYFIPEPKKDSDWQDPFEAWRGEMHEWIKSLGIKKDEVHELDVEDDERAHYSKKTIDFEYDFPFGRKELYGLAYRTDFDLKNHGLDYTDQEGHKFIPHVIEPSLGVERTVLAVLLSAYYEEKDGDEIRTVLRLPSALAPVKIAIFPLMKNKPELIAMAKEIYHKLKKTWVCEFDDNGNIGKRYRRQDEIGTPYCVTIDFDTLDNGDVTVRDRDTMKQERVKITELQNYFSERL